MANYTHKQVFFSLSYFVYNLLVMKVVIVIPTYNEEGNIGRLLDLLASELSGMKNHEFDVLIVDGNSTDRTREIVNEKSSKYPFIHLLKEENKEGLGSAYVKGFDYAIKNLGAEILVEMDADFQHDPKDISRLMAEVDNGYDCVLGSRFVKGGSIPREWAFYRRFLSIGGSTFTKFVLGIYDIHDFTSGFRATNVKNFIDKIDFSEPLSRGFAYKINLLFNLHKLGAKIKEIPINFGLRDRGNSKMEKSNFLDSLKVVLLLRYRESQSFFKFIAVGFSGLGTDSLIFNLMRLTPIGSKYASIISGFIAMVVTFTLNNSWSFSDRKIVSLSTKFKKFALFALFSYIPIIFRSWLIGFFAHKISDTFLVVNTAFFIGILIGLIWNFTVYSRIILKKKKNG